MNMRAEVKACKDAVIAMQQRGEPTIFQFGANMTAYYAALTTFRSSIAALTHRLDRIEHGRVA